jgi:hypothetical protein
MGLRRSIGRDDRGKETDPAFLLVHKIPQVPLCDTCRSQQINNMSRGVIRRLQSEDGNRDARQTLIPEL